MKKLPLKRSKHDGGRITWYEQPGCRISVHKHANVALIDYGYELRTITLEQAAALIKRMRRGEAIEYGFGHI